MTTNDENKINKLAEEKLEDLLFKKEMKELNNSLKEIVLLLPTTLVDLKKAIDIINKNINNSDQKNNTQIKYISDQLDSITNRFIQIEAIILKLQNCSDFPEQILNDINFILVDKNNNKSVLIQLQEQLKSLETLTIDLANELNKKIEVRTNTINTKLNFTANLKKNIGWVIGLLATIVLTLDKLKLI